MRITTLFPTFRGMALLLFACLLQNALFANDYQKAWEALNKNDRKSARTLFEKAAENPATAADAATMLLLLDNFEGKSSGKNGKNWERIRAAQSNPYPYAFALWFQDEVAGDYGVKEKHQLKMLEKLIEDPKTPGYIRASAAYQLSRHYLAEDDPKKMGEMSALNGILFDWQFAGPFDNISDSGFDKNYAPIANPKPEAKFKSTYGADIAWFTPLNPDNDGWVGPKSFVRNSTAIVYAQTFVNMPADQEVMLAAGFDGNIKVWVNDRLVIKEREVRQTDYDAYRAKCRLKKGNNRILVQLGYEEDIFPNFAIRITNTGGQLIEQLKSSSKYQAYPAESGDASSELTPFEPEQFFEQKIKTQPDNLLNYYLLATSYSRSGKFQEALETIQKALAIAPDNSFLHYQRFRIYNSLENRTDATQEVQYFKEKEPDSFIGMEFLYQEAVENEQYDEAWRLLKKRIDVNGEDEVTWIRQIELKARESKIDELLKLIETGSKKYPESVTFARMRHDIEEKLHKDPRAAMKVYEDLLDDNFNYSITTALLSDYFNQGMIDKGVALLTKLEKTYPFDPDHSAELFGLYYGVKDNRKAKQYLEKMLALSPFESAYWEQGANLAEQMGDKDEAKKYLEKALHYNPNDYDARRKIRELSNQKALETYVPEPDINALIKKTQPDTETNEYGFYYLTDDVAVVLHPEGNEERYHTMLVKITNEAGIDRWKESSIGYNGYRQRLIVEKAEVIKPNGSKNLAEQNGGDLVFTDLAKGDIVHVRYHTLGYIFGGKMSREWSDQYAFDGSVRVENSRYRLLTHKDLKYNYTMTNADYKPTEENFGEFVLRTWSSQNEPYIKAETCMPSWGDQNKKLHLSTIDNWSEVTAWYADLSNTQARSDYFVRSVVKELFPEGKKFTETEKAQAIYNYIVKNIRYSSVPFRQSGLVPQRASKVIQTKLGDCKDLSTLYAAIAREVGMKADLVLVDTRDNGEKDLMLPSIGFNHCIVRTEADGKPYFLELTDANLPFGHLPHTDVKALALEIPFDPASSKAEPKVFLLNPSQFPKNYRGLDAQISLDKRDLLVKADAERGGPITANIRNIYKLLSQEKRIEELQSAIGGNSASPVIVKSATFGDLDQLKDSLHFQSQYTVKNAIIEIGSLKTFKVPFYYSVFRGDVFSEENRKHPILFWRYDVTEQYNEKYLITLPAGKQFAEIPTNVDLKFKTLRYQIKYVKNPQGTLSVERDIHLDPDLVVSPAEYEQFRKFIEDVLETESKYIAFK